MNQYSLHSKWILISLLAATFITPDITCLAEETAGQKGLAAEYAFDKGIEKDPDVIVFTDFETEQWHKYWSGGKRKTVSVLNEDKERGFEPFQNKALRIKVSKGGHYGASIEYNFENKTGSEPEEIYFRYYLRLGNDWNPRRGGKLPGISGTYNRGGWGGRPSNGRNGWSARGQFNGQKEGKTPTIPPIDHLK